MDDEYFMRIALNEAKKALQSGNYPVGAVLVINKKFIASSSNQNQIKNSW